MHPRGPSQLLWIHWFLCLTIVLPIETDADWVDEALTNVISAQDRIVALLVAPDPTISSFYATLQHAQDAFLWTYKIMKFLSKSGLKENSNELTKIHSKDFLIDAIRGNLTRLYERVRPDDEGQSLYVSKPRRQELWDLFGGYQSALMGSEARRKVFPEDCDRTKPQGFLIDLRSIVVEDKDESAAEVEDEHTEFVTELLVKVRENRTRLIDWFKVIVVDAIGSAHIRLACLGIKRTQENSVWKFLERTNARTSSILDELRLTHETFLTNIAEKSLSEMIAPIHTQPDIPGVIKSIQVRVNLTSTSSVKWFVKAAEFEGQQQIDSKDHSSSILRVLQWGTSRNGENRKSRTVAFEIGWCEETMSLWEPDEMTLGDLMLDQVEDELSRLKLDCSSPVPMSMGYLLEKSPTMVEANFRFVLDSRDNENGVKYFNGTLSDSGCARWIHLCGGRVSVFLVMNVRP